MAHLAGGLVGEGHREDAVHRHAVDLVEPGDAVGEHPILRRALRVLPDQRLQGPAGARASAVTASRWALAVQFRPSSAVGNIHPSILRHASPSAQSQRLGASQEPIARKGVPHDDRPLLLAHAERPDHPVPGGPAERPGSNTASCRPTSARARSSSRNTCGFRRTTRCRRSSTTRPPTAARRSGVRNPARSCPTWRTRPGVSSVSAAGADAGTQLRQIVVDEWLFWQMGGSAR